MSRPRGRRQGHRRSLRLHRIPENPQSTRLRPGRIDRRGVEAVSLAELGAGRSGGRFGLRAGGFGAIHQAAAGRGQENPRHRPLRGPAANPLRPERRHLGLPADGRGERGGGVCPGDRGRPVRHEARRGLPRVGAFPEGRHRGRHRPAYAGGPVQFPLFRPTGHLAVGRGIRSGKPARVGGGRLAGHRRDGPGDLQRLSRVAAEHSAGRQPFYQGPDQGVEAHLRQGGAFETQRRHGRRSEGAVSGDEDRLQRSADRVAAVAQLFLEPRPGGEDRADHRPGKRHETSRSAPLPLATSRLRDRETGGVPPADRRAGRLRALPSARTCYPSGCRTGWPCRVWAKAPSTRTSCPRKSRWTG